MPNPSRSGPRCRPTPITPRRTARQRLTHLLLCATAIVLGLALGSTLVLVVMPKRKAVAQSLPIAPPKASPAMPSWSIPNAHSPASIPTPALTASLPPVAETPRPPALQAKAPEEKVVRAVQVPQLEVVRPQQVPLLVVKRMHERTADQVRAQVKKARNVKLDKTTARTGSGQMVKAMQATPTGRANTDSSLAVLDQRIDLAGLPLRRGSACRVAPEAAKELVSGAAELKSLGYDRLVGALSSDKLWTRPERIPALMQVLMAEEERKRRVLVRHLARIDGALASAALAQVALFDPEPEIRREAVSCLESRPADEYRRQLLRGFASPWPVVAEHAAEALGALKRTETVLSLLAVLNGPDPQSPYAKGPGPARFVKEVVRINHKINCLMCHPPSLRDTDPARATVPTLDELSTPKAFGGYGNFGGKNNTFVRVDITYLKQDYSVILPGVESGPFQGEQRYDLFVRERFAASEDLIASAARKKAGLTGQQKAAVFALRELTGVEPGPDAVKWRQFAQTHEQLVHER